MNSVTSNNPTRCLWSSDDKWGIYCIYGIAGRCTFNVMIKNKPIKEWTHAIKNVDNICFIKDQNLNGSSKLFKMLWHRDEAVYCDYIRLSPDGETEVNTEVIVEVNFIISRFYVIWSQGILCLLEKTLNNLHIFSTGHDHYMGYITLHSNVGAQSSLLQFDNDTSLLWAIVRKYDEATKTSSALLNSYVMPEFQLATTISLPSGFSQYTFADESAITEVDLTETKIKSILMCCSCDLSNKSAIQWYLTPKKPWKQLLLNHAISLNMKPELTSGYVSKFTNCAPKPLIETNFQPALSILELKKLLLQ